MPLNAEALRREAYKLLEQADQLAAVPAADPYPDGTVVTFQKYVVQTLRDLSYAAIRADGRWYVSGRYGPNNITWAKLVEFVEVSNLKTLRHVTATAPAVKL